jgi:AraC-like DNA-binding protein
MKLDRAYPVAALHDYVRCFEQREADIHGAAVVYSIAARPDQIMEFYLQQPYVVRDCVSGSQDVAPRAVVVGPCTHRHIELVLYGRFLVFTVHFRASGFHRLFRAPMHELVDSAYDAQSVIGNSMLGIKQRLAQAAEFRERVRAATAFLLQRLTARPSFDPVAMIANQFPVGGALRVGDAAVRAGLSIRQFERRFAEHVGLSPKLYASIVRFNVALQAKTTAPQRLWTDIAQEAGYYDQMHMVRDFARFAGESPSIFATQFRKTQENWARCRVLTIADDQTIVTFAKPLALEGRDSWQLLALPNRRIGRADGPECS